MAGHGHRSGPGCPRRCYRCHRFGPQVVVRLEENRHADGAVREQLSVRNLAGGVVCLLARPVRAIPAAQRAGRRRSEEQLVQRRVSVTRDELLLCGGRICGGCDQSDSADRGHADGETRTDPGAGRSDGREDTRRHYALLRRRRRGVRHHLKRKNTIHQLKWNFYGPILQFLF